jgi:putative transposase
MKTATAAFPSKTTSALEMVNQPQTEKELAAIRQCVNRGQPFGNPEWVQQTATKLGLESTLRKRGPPSEESQVSLNELLPFSFPPPNRSR